MEEIHPRLQCFVVGLDFFFFPLSQASFFLMLKYMLNPVIRPQILVLLEKKKNLAPLKSTWPIPVAKQTYYNQEMGHVEKGETTAGRAKERRNGIGNKK